MTSNARSRRSRTLLYQPLRYYSSTPDQLTKEDVSQIEAGTHPTLASLSSPINTTTDNKTSITDLRAPHIGIIKVLSLNDPSSMNALGRTLISELSAVVEAIHAEACAPGLEQTRVLVLSSLLDKAFCAGANLKERAGMSLQEANEFLTGMRWVFKRLETLPVPVIAAVHGLALGGGLELALRAHIRVFSANAQVGQPETRLGIIPGAGATFRLPQVVGEARALDMILSGRRLDATVAREWGLCTHVAGLEARDEGPQGQREAVLKEAVRLAGMVCLGAPVAVRMAVDSVKPSGQAVVGEAHENKCYDSVLHTADRNEALLAFKEKRLPRFRGE